MEVSIEFTVRLHWSWKKREICEETKVREETRRSQK